MTPTQAMKNIKAAIHAAPRNDFIAELHLQVIKYAEHLQTTTGKEFCKQVGLTPSFGTEYSKMRKIAERLRKAGLNTDKI
ncbi:MAG TPA: transcription factor [Phycisphaerae bacterium]|jgi:hypothetical protein|nr:transcription factor [Phycisphaerae bacterium]